MKKVFIIHGYNGEPNGGWRPWLMGKLAEQDIWACALPMPTPDKPKKDEWTKTVSDAVGEPTEEIFLVGHSLGVPAVLNYLQSVPKDKKIGGAVLTSGFIRELEPDKYREIDAFVNKGFDFDHIKNVCKEFSVIHGTDDTSVPFSQAEEISKNLACDLIPIPNGGHLNGNSGWYELPEALEALNKMLNF